ncbi:MAG: nicotinate-nicotinamide nucleotide adenylyltransferase [Fibrobacter sp.]|uniref:nicotinate-nicotinamide nucleotide adenylyltransferase n=1 Tax=Fibrobacter sp. UWP2 TaxID=1896216 RepID=UPI00091F2B76|nr:nicotinate-nicotinamide nucleotide adenylyltransferase [Fibrobacter sp. UWP2]MBO7384084.1 nicotinate-nicotinamide nucleotide adenylyltransferase [Fibrobacter sp.]MCR5379096.1 nicotinate-nicotinamide nucleotide adenylyltransferase [Fibrobacter sp.]SHI59350.1 nicotinate-nucleotide adenylyltransferase [Fibrobacter sp. UWP2]
MKKVAIMGGAFDPVHKDHVAAAKMSLDCGLCEEVWFMPSPDRWDKTLNASPEDRFAMLELAFSGDKRMVLSDLEIEQGEYRGSYVFLMGLKEKFPDIHFLLLTGADSYEGIPHWRDPMTFFGTNYNGHLLLRDIELIVFARKGYPKPDLEQHKANGYAPLHWLGKEQGFVGKYSSTEIRKVLPYNRTQCPEGLEPTVFQYILDHDLYRE